MAKMHVSINVRDLARSLTFYQAFFGITPHKIRPGYANFDLAEPPLKFALNERNVAPESGSLNHLGFQVATLAEVEAAKARLQQAGLATFDETDTVCCYAKQDKIWAHDPDGNAWEVYVLTDDLLDGSADALANQPMAMQPPSLRGTTIISLQPVAAAGVAPRVCCDDA
ncbi:MAG: VOC family protein [Roseiflexaceae bacterium]|nr:VOC family protein [Roseiflexaceae bacterium]